MSADGNETRLACNETSRPCNESTCLLCGAPLEQRPTGRPRRFCSPAHRVRHHRLRSRSDIAAPDAGAAEVAGPQQPDPPRQDTGEPAEVLRNLADELEDFRPTARVAELRRLASYAQDVEELLDTIETSAWALHDFTGVGYDLECLLDHRHTLQRLSELDDLADDIERLARELRAARDLRDELFWAAEQCDQANEQPEPVRQPNAERSTVDDQRGALSDATAGRGAV